MTDLADQLFDSFEKEVEINSVNDAKVDELKNKESSNLLNDAFCSNCHKEFMSSSLKANLLDQICGDCNEKFQNTLKKSTGTLVFENISAIPFLLIKLHFNRQLYRKHRMLLLSC